jgi:CheY-like chemotaxis protein
MLINEIGDDRDNIHPGDRVLLIVENDERFARFLLDMAREKGFKGLVTSLGAAALAMTQEYKPSALTLDISLPDIEGWRVLERLKNDIFHRHVPVYVVSTEEAAERALAAGARGFLAKPIQSKDLLDRLLDEIRTYGERKRGSVLVVAADAHKSGRIRQTLDGADDLEIVLAPDTGSALATLRERAIDLLVLDASMPDVATTLLAEPDSDLEASRQPAIVVLREGGHGAEHDREWDRLAKTRVLRQVDSMERLLDQSTLLLHRDAVRLPDDHRSVLEDLYLSNKSLAGKKVLIVDDDMRNIFALASVLEEYQMRILSADNGATPSPCCKRTRHRRHTDGYRMPEMDGRTTRAIRALPDGKNVPIIAVTAKAMKGDRDRCLEAGAWDYLSKPVDREQLLATLRAWLYR